jgi:hypothetical protein
LDSAIDRRRFFARAAGGARGRRAERRAGVGPGRVGPGRGSLEGLGGGVVDAEDGAARLVEVGAWGIADAVSASPVWSKPGASPTRPKTSPRWSKPETSPMWSKPETSPMRSKPETSPMRSKPGRRGYSIDQRTLPSKEERRSNAGRTGRAVQGGEAGHRGHSRVFEGIRGYSRVFEGRGSGRDSGRALVRQATRGPDCGQTIVWRRSNAGQTPVSHRSNTGQTLVKHWSASGQTLVKHWSGTGARCQSRLIKTRWSKRAGQIALVKTCWSKHGSSAGGGGRLPHDPLDGLEPDKHWSITTGQTLVKHLSNAGQALVKRWSSAGQTLVKRWSNGRGTGGGGGLPRGVPLDGLGRRARHRRPARHRPGRRRLRRPTRRRVN